MNKVNLVGNLSQDIVLRGEKTTYCFLKVAVKSDNGATNFISVKVFAELAKSCFEVLQKGDRVEINGYIQGERYDKETETGFPQAIVAINVEKLERAITSGIAKAVAVKTDSEGEVARV